LLGILFDADDRGDTFLRNVHRITSQKTEDFEKYFYIAELARVTSAHPRGETMGRKQKQEQKNLREISELQSSRLVSVSRR
jgi:hypothetical protein